MQHEDGGSKCRGGQESAAHVKRAGTAGEGDLFAEVTVEEQAAIRQFLNQPGAPGTEAGRAAALARAALKFAGVLLLAAGVVAGCADGNEFDEVGCSVALQPGGPSHGAHSAQTRERAGGKVPGSDGGSAGASGGGGPGGPSGGGGPDGRPECEGRAQKWRMRNAECGVGNEEVMRVLGEIRREVAAVGRLLAGEPLPDARPGARHSRPKSALPGESSQASAESSPVYVFRKVGRRWEVIAGGGRPFHLPNILGSRYLNYLLHEPNEPISAFDLEVKVQPEKGAARSRDSIQHGSDRQALREYREALRRAKGERANAEAAGDAKEVQRLDGQIAALESALRGGRGATDAGERARGNVRKAIAVVMARLRQGGPEEKAFAEHLRTYLSLGHECLYSQPDGRVWG
jgi:hypothetical protein